MSGKIEMQNTGLAKSDEISEVEAYLDRLEAAIRDRNEIDGNIRDRIARILAPEYPKTANDSREQEEELCPLADRIRSLFKITETGNMLSQDVFGRIRL